MGPTPQAMRPGHHEHAQAGELVKVNPDKQAFVGEGPVEEANNRPEGGDIED